MLGVSINGTLQDPRVRVVRPFVEGMSDSLIVLRSPLKGLALHLLPVRQDQLSSPLRHIGGRHISQGLAVASVVLEPNEVLDGGLQVCGALAKNGRFSRIPPIPSPERKKVAGTQAWC